MKAAGFAFVVLVSSLAAQTANLVTSAGYSAPEPLEVAPGQVITLFSRTKTKLPSSLRASDSLAPTLLGGYMVHLKQTFSEPRAIPILSASPVDTCTGVLPVSCTSYTAITVQIPFELIPNAAGSRLPENFATLTVVDNGEMGEPMPVHPISDKVHILNSCDVPLHPQSTPCLPVLLHADGSVVTAAKPAQPGEQVALHAYGLGMPDDRIASGVAAPSPAIGVSGVSIDFNYGTGTSMAGLSKSAISASAELLPATVGLYRVSFIAPSAPAGTPACSAVTTNATVVVGRVASFDVAGLCLYVANPGNGTNEVPPRGRR